MRVFTFEPRTSSHSAVPSLSVYIRKFSTLTRGTTPSTPPQQQEQKEQTEQIPQQKIDSEGTIKIEPEKPSQSNQDMEGTIKLDKPPLDEEKP